MTVWGRLEPVNPNSGTDVFTMYELRDSYTIGRALTQGQKADFLIDSRKVSKIHCRIKLNGVGVILEDTSTNGCWINGFRVDTRQQLNSGDRLCLLPPCHADKKPHFSDPLKITSLMFYNERQQQRTGSHSRERRIIDLADGDTGRGCRATIPASMTSDNNTWAGPWSAHGRYGDSRGRQVSCESFLPEACSMH